MKGNDKIVGALNSLLSGELAAVNQYILHTEMCQNWLYVKLHDAIRTRAIDEMNHAETLIARILFLEGIPNVSRLGAISAGSDVPDIHAKDLGAEVKTIADYNAAIKIAQQFEDSGTREMLEAILTDEESHLDWIEGQQKQISQMGLATYLGSQTK